MSDTPEAWGDWLRSFRERFIAKQGWTNKEAKLRIRDGWACVRDGRVHVMDGDDQRPAGAVPVFQMLTLGGWKLAIRLEERLSGSQTSSDISRLDGVVLSAGTTCRLPERGDMPREGEICR
jgi:hypothetical protein